MNANVYLCILPYLVLCHHKTLNPPFGPSGRDIPGQAYRLEPWNMRKILVLTSNMIHMCTRAYQDHDYAMKWALGLRSGPTPAHSKVEELQERVGGQTTLGQILPNYGSPLYTSLHILWKYSNGRKRNMCKTRKSALTKSPLGRCFRLPAQSHLIWQGCDT